MGLLARLRRWGRQWFVVQGQWVNFNGTTYRVTRTVRIDNYGRDYLAHVGTDLIEVTPEEKQRYERFRGMSQDEKLDHIIGLLEKRSVTTRKT